MTRAKPYQLTIYGSFILLFFISIFNLGLEKYKQSHRPDPVNTDTYAQMEAQTGCRSVNGDDKKEDIFRREYKNHIMTFSGRVISNEGGLLAISANGNIIADVRIGMKDPKAIYDTPLQSNVTVRFKMIQRGDCLANYYGNNGELVKP